MGSGGRSLAALVAILAISAGAVAQVIVYAAPFYTPLYGVAVGGAYYGGGGCFNCGYSFGRGGGFYIKRDVNLTELQSVLPNVSRPLGDELHNKDAGKNLTFLLPSNDALRKLVGMMTPQQQQQQMSAMPAGGQQQPGAQQQQPAPPAGGPNKPELLTNGTALTAVLSYHILEGRYALSDFRDGMKINTMLGPQAGPLTVSVRDDKVTFIGAGSNATIMKSLKVCHGDVYIVDNVLLPVKPPPPQ